MHAVHIPIIRHRRLQFRRAANLAIQVIVFLFAAVALAASAESQPAAKPPTSPNDLSLFTINELEGAPDALPLSASVPSQDWVRAWFKWGNAPDLKGLGYMIRLAHQHGALFGGGVTCSALYPHENGITNAQFMDMATRDPDGHLYLVDNSIYHGSLENPAYRRYVLKWAEQQIDAGVDTLFMDEVNGAYSSHEGFDKYGLAAFRRYLIHRFVQHDRWSITDPRWVSRFHIDFQNATECPNHTIRTFNYAAYLRINHWEDKPDDDANPLAPIWGSPGDITADTYSADRNNRVWRYWVTHLRAYAAHLHRRVWIAANGLNRWVDYQMGGCSGNFPLSPDGQLSCTGSNLAHWRAAYERSQELMDGKNVPIMVFHDWGVGMPWMNLTPAERVAWLDAYAPEVFASGLFFAYPVHGPYNCDASTNGTLSTIQKQSRFVESVAPLLHQVVWQDPNAARYTGKAEITLEGQPQNRRLVIHLINRDYEGLTPLMQTDQRLRVALAVRPESVFIHNADTGTVTRAAWSYDAYQRLPDRLTYGVFSVIIPSLKTWDIVEVILPRWVAIPAPTEITIPCAQVWARPAQSVFPITVTRYQPLLGVNRWPAWLWPRGFVPTRFQQLFGLNGIIQGRLHPELRNNPTFIVRFRRPGRFEVHVNSVAIMGASLIIRVDDKQMLATPISDRDGKNDRNAEDINKTYSIPVTKGLHYISIDNNGADWLTVDWYRFIGI